MSLENLVKNQKKIMQYIKSDKEVSRKLFKANSLNEKKDIIKNSALDPFIKGIVDSPQYDLWTAEVSELIIEENPEVKQEVTDEMLGLKRHKKKKIKKTAIKKYKSKTASGKVYSKGYSKWDKSQEIFLKSRNKKNIKEVIKEYNEFFDEKRSDSSIKTKFYRLRRK